MNTRQHQIVSMLKTSDKWIKGSELSSLFQVTPRTIRSDIQRINQLHHTELIQSHSHLGYRVDPIKLSEFATSAPETTEAIPETPNQRMNFILKELLLRRKPINLVLLQEPLCASVSTLEKDVRKIRIFLQSNSDLKIIKQGDTIKLSGSEEAKRKLHRELINKEVSNNFLNLNAIAKLYKSFDFIHICDVMQTLMNQNHYMLRPASLHLVMIHVGVALERIMHSHYLSMDIDKDIDSTLEYKIATNFYQQIAAELGIHVPVMEKRFLALLLLGRQSDQYQSDKVIINQHEYSIISTTRELLKQVDMEMSINLSSDEELCTNLSMHLRSYAHRLMQKQEMQNLFLHELKKQYPWIFELGVAAANYLEKLWDIKVSEDEIGFLSLHLGNAYERLNTNPRVRAVIIYPHESSFAHVCEQKIHSQFKEKLEIVASLSHFEEKQINELHPDLILTTIPVDHQLHIPTVQISLFITLEDESKIFQSIQKILLKSSYSHSIKRLQKIIREDFFFTDVEVDSPEQLIEIICRKATKEAIVPIGFHEDVIKREMISSTSFVQGFATPHAMNLNAIESMISVSVLKKPIKWGEYQVKLVFLLTLREDDHDILRFFFEWFASIMDKKDIMNELMNVTNYESFMQKVVNLEEN